MFDYKQILVERSINCPMCDEEKKIGDIMFKDEYRNEIICPSCKQSYEEEVYREEGEDGRLLK